MVLRLFLPLSLSQEGAGEESLESVALQYVSR